MAHRRGYFGSLKKMNETQKKFRKNRKINKLCILCGKKIDKYNYCALCLLRRRMATLETQVNRISKYLEI